MIYFKSPLLSIILCIGLLLIYLKLVVVFPVVPGVAVVLPAFAFPSLVVLLDEFPEVVPVLDEELAVLPPLDAESFPGVVTVAGELSSSTFILSSLPVASFDTAYIPKFCFTYSYNILYFLWISICCRWL